MAATNFTPIILYHTTTASAAPTAGNLNNGELAINITDGKLFYKDNGGTVQVIATKGTGTIGGSNTQVQYNSSGALAGSANFTFNGTTATINTLNLTNALGTAYGGTALTTYTQGDLVYASAANTLAKLGIGANTYILTSTGSVPQWSAPSAVTVATATNLAGGAAGSVPYQSGASTTTFLSIGTQNQVLTSSGTAPQWSSGLTITTLATTGNTTLGDAAADNLTVNATITSNLIFTDNTYDIGASGATRPRSLFLGTNLTVGSLTATRVPYASTGGLLVDSANMTFNGTRLSVADFADASLTSGRVTYATTSGNLTDSANLLYSGTDLTVYGITVGRGAGAVSTNTAVGASALAANTTGGRNTALGNEALFSNTTGNNNLAVGGRDDAAWTPLYSNTTGSNNVAVGNAALSRNTTASNNTAVGYQAGYNNTTGTSLVFLGYLAGYAGTTAIENTGVGYRALTSATTGNYNTAVGTNSGAAVTTGAANTSLGRSSLQTATTASDNTAIGYRSMISATTGGANTALGSESLQANTTGVNIVALGYGALYSNTTGANNTAVGYNAGRSETTGGSNTFLGLNAGYTQNGGGANTFIGREAGLGVTTGSYNTFVGAWNGSGNGSGSAVTTGSKNTILGGYSGNQGGLDIRTANNYIVLSDGDGNPRIINNGAQTLLGAVAGVASGRLEVTGDLGNQYAALVGIGKGDITNQVGQQLVLIDSDNTALRANFIVEDTGTRGGLFIQATESGVSNDRDLYLAAAGGIITVGGRSPDTSGGAIQLQGTTYGGITFPATQVASSQANTLDDYEEGTWTPVLTATGSAPTVSYLTQEGKYTKVGNTVTIWWGIRINTISGGSGTVRISGLPFTAPALTAYANPAAVTNAQVLTTGGTVPTIFYVESAASTMQGRVFNNADTPQSIGDYQAGSYIVAQLQYYIS